LCLTHNSYFRAGVVAHRYTCLAYAKPWLQSLVRGKRKQNKNNNPEVIVRKLPPNRNPLAHMTSLMNFTKNVKN
jgi:hypothetical protein